jgi:hypothetical protein
VFHDRSRRHEGDPIMSNEDRPTPVETVGRTEAAEGRAEARRKFLRTAGQVAVTTPAVTMLLSAGTKQSQAGAMVHYVVDGPDASGDEGQDGKDCAIHDCGPPSEDTGIDPGGGDDSPTEGQLVGAVLTTNG